MLDSPSVSRQGYNNQLQIHLMTAIAVVINKSDSVDYSRDKGRSSPNYKKEHVDKTTGVNARKVKLWHVMQLNEWANSAGRLLLILETPPSWGINVQ